jgi:hypothetical protein
MARYNDYVSRSEVCKVCLNKGIDCGKEKCPVNKAPTADVVPKSEVEKLKAIIADHKASEERWEELFSNTKTEVAREFIDAVDSMLNLVCAMTGLELTYLGKYAELKKKYTED